MELNFKLKKSKSLPKKRMAVDENLRGQVSEVSLIISEDDNNNNNNDKKVDVGELMQETLKTQHLINSVLAGFFVFVTLWVVLFMFFVIIEKQRNYVALAITGPTAFVVGSIIFVAMFFLGGATK